jgi:hypothetical protein
MECLKLISASRKPIVCHRDTTICIVSLWSTTEVKGSRTRAEKLCTNLTGTVVTTECIKLISASRKPVGCHWDTTICIVSLKGNRTRGGKLCTSLTGKQVGLGEIRLHQTLAPTNASAMPCPIVHEAANAGVQGSGETTKVIQANVRHEAMRPCCDVPDRFGLIKEHVFMADGRT